MFEWLFGKRTIKREIVVNAEKLETRVAIVEDGRVEELRVEHPDQERLVGSIFKGRVQNLENDLQAAFVDIGLKKNAFLHYWDMFPEADPTDFVDGNVGDDDSDDMLDANGAARKRNNNSAKKKRYDNDFIAKRFKPGTEIIVQIVKGPIGTKGPRITTNVSIPGRYIVMIPNSHTRGVSAKIADPKERARLKKIIDRLPMPKELGMVVRTIGTNATKRALARDLRSLLAIWEELQTNVSANKGVGCVYQEPNLIERVVRDHLTEDIDRVSIDNREAYEHIRAIAAKISRRARNIVTFYDGPTPIFTARGVEQQLAEAFARKVPLKSGGYLVIDETEALIAIDVNTGRHKGAGSQEETIVEVNLEAVEEIARQLRLRNIGGLVVIDLIDMKQRKHQAAIYKAMRNAIKRDNARTNILPISELGLMELTRQRQEESLLARNYDPCPYCHGRGVVKSALTVSIALQRQIASVMRKLHDLRSECDLMINIAPCILERLRNEDEEALVELQNNYSAKLHFKTDPFRHPESFTIQDASGKVLYSVDPR